MAAIRPRQSIAASKYFAKLGLTFPTPSHLVGHEEVVAQQVLFPLLTKLGYDTTKDLQPKPSLEHAIVGERREADYGILPYATVPRNSKLMKLFGMVADVKKFKEALTPQMEEKLAGYCALFGALYGILTNGEELVVVKPVRGAVDWDYVNEIPNRTRLANESRGYSSGTQYTESDLIYATRIVSIPDTLDEKTIEKVAIDCHNIIRRRSGMQVPERLYEFSKLFLLRILDEREYVEGNKKELNITYKNILELKEKKVDIKAYVNKRFSDVAKKLEIFDEKERISLDEGVIEETIQVLDVHALWLRKMDILAQIYEKFLINTMTGQELGQFFTPRTIVNLMVKMVDPDHGQRILDPSCGMAGFLLYSLFHVMQKVPEKRDAVACEFYGIEIDDSTAKLAKINSWLHQDSHKNITRANSFDPAQAPEFLIDAIKEPSESGFDIILTNPPFGSKGKNRYEAETLQIYAEGWAKKGITLFECASGSEGYRSCGAQSLFLELCIKALRKPHEKSKNGKASVGRLCTVIDYGILSNTQKEEPEIRKLIRRDTIIEAVISLPKGTFKVYGSNVVPCILLLKRKANDEEEQSQIFRADVHKIGFVPAVDRYRVESDADLTTVEQYWQKWKTPW